MKRFKILFLLIIAINTYGQYPDLPEYEGTQPVWHHFIEDNLRDTALVKGSVFNIITDGQYMYYSNSLEQRVVTSNAEYSEQTGVLIQKYDLQDGSLVWSNQYEYPYTIDSMESHSRLLQDDDGNVVLYGLQLIEKENEDRSWQQSAARSTTSFVTRTFDPETGELIAKVVGKDSIRNPYGINWRNHFLDIDRRLLLNNKLFGYNKFFGFWLVPYDEHNTIDSSGIAEFREYVSDTSYFVTNPKINYIRDGFMKAGVERYVFDDNWVLSFKKATYYELDFRDIYNVKIVDSFDVSGRLADLPTNPINDFTYYEFGEDVMYSTHIHYTDGNHGAWIAWYDYDGNYLGGHDYINLAHKQGGEAMTEPIYWTFKNMIINDRFYLPTFVNDKRNGLIMSELSPDFLPTEIGRIECTNYQDIARNFGTYYDAYNHQIIYTSLIDDPESEAEADYNYIAAFNADDLGIKRPSATQEIVREPVKVYPNPVVNNVTIDLDGKPFSGLVQIYDLTGRTIYAQHVRFTGRHQINISHAAAGTYQVKLLSEDTAYEVVEIIKMR